MQASVKEEQFDPAYIKTALKRTEERLAWQEDLAYFHVDKLTTPQLLRQLHLRSLPKPKRINEGCDASYRLQCIHALVGYLAPSSYDESYSEHFIEKLLRQRKLLEFRVDLNLWVNGGKRRGIGALLQAGPEDEVMAEYGVRLVGSHKKNVHQTARTYRRTLEEYRVYWANQVDKDGVPLKKAITGIPITAVPTE
jgi:hypothetical protein